MTAPSFNIGLDPSGVPIRSTLAGMTAREVLQAVAFQRDVVARLELAALGVFRRVGDINPDKMGPMEQEAAAMVIPARDKAIIRETLTERAIEDVLHAAIKAAMPRWDTRRLDLAEALQRYWQRSN